MVEAALLDIDGTLMDNNALHVLAWQRAFRRAGYEMRGDELLDRLGMGGDKLPGDILGPDAGDVLEQLSKMHSEEYSDKGLVDHAEPLPGATDLLSKLKERGLKVALASSGKPHEIEVYMEKVGGEDAIDALVTSGEVEGSKPDPDIFARAMERLGHPSSAVVIGDTVYDVQSASKLGLPCVCVLSGGIERERLIAAGAVAVYDNAADLLEHLDEVVNPPQLSEVALGNA